MSSQNLDLATGPVMFSTGERRDLALLRLVVRPHHLLGKDDRRAVIAQKGDVVDQLDAVAGYFCPASGEQF